MHPYNDFENKFVDYVLSVPAQDSEGESSFPIVYQARPVRHEGNMTIWNISGDQEYEQDIGVPSNDDPFDYLALHIKGRHPGGDDVLGTWRAKA